jgi:hypothetical protein
VNDNELHDKFEAEMWRLVDEPLKRFGYNAGFYRRMLREHGALETARRLAGDPRYHDGLTRLWQERALDLSVEAVVLRSPWNQLFSAEVLAAARAKLDALGYSERAENDR